MAFFNALNGCSNAFNSRLKNSNGFPNACNDFQNRFNASLTDCKCLLAVKRKSVGVRFPGEGHKYQANSSCVIYMSVILMNTLFHEALIPN